MKQYCGTDIIEVSRVRNAILETKGFKERVYTENEILIGENKLEAAKYQYYAGRFAAKEAIYKALSAYNREITFKDIEVINDEELNNRPKVNVLKDSVAYMMQNGKVQIDVSISHIKEYAMATAVVCISK